ncbi:MAG: hypothetical protein WD981_00715 [Gaiellaceae bacterium]
MKTLMLIGATGLVAVAAAAAHGPAPVPGKGPGMLVQGTTQATVWIRHAQRGCHVWTTGTRSDPTARVTLRRGGRLTVVNQDVDMHRIVQKAGTRVATGRSMAMNQRTTLVFRRPGVYRFETRIAEMPGMKEVETLGADWLLRLVVTVR